MTKPEPGTHWDHKREGYGVRIAKLGNDNALYMKDANDAGWQKAVAYQIEGGDSAEGDSRILVRAEADFLAKFTQDERLGDEE